MSVRQVQSPWLSDVIDTTDATVTTSAACSYTPPNGSAGTCEYKVVARNTSTGTMVAWRAEAPWKKVGSTLTVGSLLNVGGAALALVGASAGDVTAFATAAISVVASAGVIQPKVQGIAATNIEWLIHCKYDVN